MLVRVLERLVLEREEKLVLERREAGVRVLERLGASLVNTPHAISMPECIGGHSSQREGRV